MSNDCKDDSECPKGDVLLQGPDLGDGSRPFVRHRADCSVVSGVLRPLQHGKPIGDGVVLVKPREDGTSLCDVVEVPLPERTGSKGPCKVTTSAFRDGWDRIFGGKTAVGQA